MQIVQVHQSDSGTYVCVADNGIGVPVEREVNLEIKGKFIFRVHVNSFVECFQKPFLTMHDMVVGN